MKKTRGDGNGTSFHGTVVFATPNQLIKVAENFGAEYYDHNNGRDKTNFEFVFETDNGDEFTVYDWKLYHKLEMDKDVEFHIGANTGYISIQGCDELEDELSML